MARLPPLPKLRIRRPNKETQNPCIGVMSQLLGCWASSGYGIEGCGKLEEALRGCMDTKVGIITIDGERVWEAPLGSGLEEGVDGMKRLRWKWTG